MDIISVPETLQMLPPPPGSFAGREELIQRVGEFALTQGYVIKIKHSKKERSVTLICDRGGVHTSTHVDESTGKNTRKRKPGTRRTNCPFECVGKKDEDLWVLFIKNGSHNHEPLKDLAEHPHARRFTEEEMMEIKEMADAGLKPSQIFKKLKNKNPELLSTPKHLYNLNAKIRQGKLTVKKPNALRPHLVSVGNWHMPTSEQSWRQRYPPRYPNLFGGRFIDSHSSASIDVKNPATQQVVSQAPLTIYEELKAAVSSAKKAFPLWRKTPISERQKIMFKFQELIRREIDNLSLNISIEHGKPLKDAHYEVLRGLEVVEHSCGTANLQMGDFANISHGIDTYSIRDPLGVCAGICPFNFPAMVPLLMFPVAVTCGNTFILKPSEKAPGAAVTLAELALEAGLPNGVLNIVHGTEEIINSLCDDVDIQAISLVGWDSATKYAYGRASASCKHVQLNTGARNFAIVMPDAIVDATLDALVTAGFGAGGQKFMVTNQVIFVGGLNLWENKLVERAKLLKLSAGTESDADLGPMITQQAKEQTCRLIQSFIDNGARLALDGCSVTVQESYEMGNFIGPTILANIRDDMECYKEEILGPVLLCLEADTLEQAINIVNRSNYSHGASIFTDSGSAARKFQTEIEAGLIGINVPVAAPLPVLSFTGTKVSFSGDLNFHGKAGVDFYTRVKTVSQQWKEFRSSSVFSSPNRELIVNKDLFENGEESLENIESFGNGEESSGNVESFENRESLAFPLFDESHQIENA